MSDRRFRDPPAASVAQALGGRRNGRGWLCRCPAHNDRSPSLSVADGEEGRLLVRCFAGCQPVDVLRAIADMDLAGGHPAPAPDPVEIEREHAEKAARATDLWRSAAEITAYDPPDVYLQLRGLGGRLGPWPGSLRYLAEARHPSGATIPAMVAAASRWPDRKVTAVQLTGLDPESCEKTKLAPARWTVGALSGAAVRLSPWQEGQELVLVEGVEDGLAVLEAEPGAAVWAGLGVSNIPSIALPRGAEIILALDGDTAGKAGARQAAKTMVANGHRVRIADLGEGLDPLDALLRGAA